MRRIGLRRRPLAWLGAMMTAVIAGYPCAAQEGEADAPAAPPGMSRAEVYREAKALSEIGGRLFADPALSGSGRMSCATCHDPANGFAPANALSVQPGGRTLEAAGTRAVPTLTYKQKTPPFSEHFHESDDEGDESVDAGPTGGLAWDGRADRADQQALIPLFAPNEMANGDRAALVSTIEARYGESLRGALGAHMPEGADGVLLAAVKALQVYQEEPALFYPYNSKYDAYLRGQATLTEKEKRGLELFEDEEKGNCASCHPSAQKQPGVMPALTDYGHIAVGLPRNMAIPANRDPGFFDLGLCGPDRKDLAEHADYCGLFKAPTLRNVALRKTFFHNGSIHSLRDAVAFYVERDVKPEKWFPRRADGEVDKFNDLPAQYHDNLNMEPPFGGKPGDEPRLTEAEIDDVVAFLETLTDGYAAPAPQPAKVAD